MDNGPICADCCVAVAVTLFQPGGTVIVRLTSPCVPELARTTACDDDVTGAVAEIGAWYCATSASLPRGSATSTAVSASTTMPTTVSTHTARRSRSAGGTAVFGGVTTGSATGSAAT